MQTRPYFNSVLSYTDDKNTNHPSNTKDILLSAKKF